MHQRLALVRQTMVILVPPHRLLPLLLHVGGDRQLGDRPAALLGSQVWATRGHKEAIEFVRKLNVAAYFNGASRGVRSQHRIRPSPAD